MPWFRANSWRKANAFRPTSPVFEVMDLSRMRVAFGVPDTRIGQFQLGQRVTVMADAFRGEHFVGQITKVSPAADLQDSDLRDRGDDQ